MIFISDLDVDLTNIVECVKFSHTCQLDMGMEERAGGFKRRVVGGHYRIPGLKNGREVDMY